MEKEISNIYKDAQKDISEKWDKFMKSHYPKLKDAQEKLKEAEKSGDKDKIKDAKDVYERTAKNITVNNRRYRNMLDDVTNKLANTNQIALDYINGEMPSIYTINYNAFGNEKIKGYSFSLVNENAIKELATKDELLVPHKDLDKDKDKRWNAKNVNSQVLQGILQGESIPKMAKRLQNVTDMNENSAIRNARTMTTSAENKGRQDSFKKAESDGVIMEREWIAAHDGHTRAWHLDLHGVRVGVDEPWNNEYGDIMYPGDPGADPANVYNCRCSMRSHVVGFAWNQESKEDVIEEKTIDDVQVEHEVVNGKDISQTWTRRSDQFDFEIEDVINAQGFDGLPRVVSPEEFERYAKESNMVALRGYTAPDEETLKAYEDQLYHGKWYVDCSVGGSAAGQGMYSSWNKGTEPAKMISDSVAGYAQGKTGKVETFTLSKDAKIITHKEAVRLKDKMDDIVDSKGEHPYRSMDEGCIAALFGYDAISIGREDMGDLVVLNRTKCIFRKGG